ncbi:MAG: CHAT domain-containing protein [Synechococcales cyanobacterium RM1_1_8]|nr:CHAT domain-containing protein [Synechococcales cyanobacterium RM1_1_8]
MGLEFREQLTPASDITASSGLGRQFNGSVELSQPSASPTAAAIALPATLADPVERLAQSCAAQRSPLQVTGRGGLAASPLDWLELEQVGLARLRDAPATDGGAIAAETTNSQTTETPNAKTSNVETESIIRDLEAAIALRHQGFYGEALEQLQRLNSNKKPSGPRGTVLQGQILRQLGISYRLMGEFDQAEAALEQSLALALEIEQPLKQQPLKQQPLKQQPFAQSASESASLSAAEALLSLGHLAATRGQVQQAQVLYQRAIAQLTSAPNLPPSQSSALQATALASLLKLAREQPAGTGGISPTALSPTALSQKALSQKLLAQLQALPAPENLAIRLHLATVQLDAKTVNAKTVNAQAGTTSAEGQMLQWELEQLLSLAQQLDDPRAIAYSLGSLGQIAEWNQAWGQAQRHSEMALQLSQASGDRLMEYQWAWQLARIHRHRWQLTGEMAWYGQSQQAYRLALEALAALRSDLLTVAPALQFSFRSEIEPVYRQYVDLLLSQPASPSLEGAADSLPNATLQEAIQTVEALRLAELDNYLQDACLTTASRSIAQVDDQAAVIYPIQLGDRLELIVSLPQGDMRRYRIPVSRATLAQTITAFRQGLVRRSGRDFQAPSQALYQWLIQPALLDLNQAGVKTLVFVPDGPFKAVPMAALSDGQRYLIEQFNVAATPSMALLPEQGQRGTSPEILGAGLSQANQGFAPLKYVAQELQDIFAAIPGKLLLDDQFTHQQLASQILKSKAPIVHIATHGQFGAQAEETFVLAWNERINLEQLSNILHSRMAQGLLPTDLLVLSACETAVGDEASSLGLAGMAVRSGARSTLASLWSVDDQSTAALMGEFYQQLSQPDVAKAEALRQTQLAMLQHPIYRHPYYWSAFVLLGDWQ